MLSKSYSLIPFLLLFYGLNFGFINAQNTTSIGTQKMAAILKTIADTADPKKVFFLNTKRADAIHSQMAQSNFQKRVGAKANYGYELLQAGKTELAIKQLETFIRSMDSMRQEIAPKFYSLLAIAYMRLGEQQNCCARHSPESCIIPIKGEGIHKLDEGSSKAISAYLFILNKDSNDLQTRWLLNLAYMTLGVYPQEVPKKYLIRFNNPATNKPFTPWKNSAPALGFNDERMLGGACMEDFDGDGFLDIMYCSQGLQDEIKLFRNNKDGSFTDVSEKTGLKGITGGCNMIHTDYNNDGFKDVFITRGGWLRQGGNLPNSLLKNNGDGTFEDVTIEAGLLSFHPSQTASWADFNNDGYLDLFVGNESETGQTHPCEFYLNNKNGTFSNVAQKLNMALIGYVKGVNWGDINNDGLPDLYCSMINQKNKLFLNKGGTDISDWKFEEISEMAGVSEPYSSFPCWFFDYDNDGWQDIFVCGYSMDRLSIVGYDAANEYLGKPALAFTPKIYKNNRNNTFTDMSDALGFGNRVCYAMGSNFGDLDNDGWLDFYLGTGSPDYRAIVPNRMFRNDGGKFFSEVTYAGGFGHLQKGHSVDFGDIDNDGDQDIFIEIGGGVEGDVFRSALFQNPGNDNKWMVLELEGTVSNKPAIGARIKVTTIDISGKKRDIYAVCGTGGSFGASSLRQEIGLGKAKEILSLEIIFPNGKNQAVVYKQIKMNKFYRIREDSDKPEEIQLKKIILKSN